MRKFADLHLKPPIGNLVAEKEMAELACCLGYSLVAVAFNPRDRDEEVNRVRKIFIDAGLDLASRVDISAMSRGELLKELGALRRDFEIVAIECKSNEALSIAQRDSRVDIIYVDATSSSRGFPLNRASSTSAHLEINMSTITKTQRPPEHLQIARIRKEIAKAKKNRLRIVVSSGADKAVYLRAPRDLAAVGMLLGLDKEAAIGSISSIPISLVNKNRVKLGSRYAEENASIVGIGDE
mgnify:CR=1 FL=1